MWTEKMYGIEVGNEGVDSKNWRASEGQYGNLVPWKHPAVYEGDLNEGSK